MQQMNKKIVKYTLIFSLFCSLVCAVIFHSQMIQVFIAVWIDCLTGLVGYRKIVQMALNIPTDEIAGKKIGYTRIYEKISYVWSSFSYLSINGVANFGSSCWAYVQ